MELIKLMEFMKTIVALFAETFVPRPAQSTQQIQFQSSLWEWEDWIELLVEEQWAAKRMQSWRKVKRIENSWAFAEAKHEARRGAAPFPFSLSQQSFLFFSLLKKRLKDCGGAEREWKGERHKEGLVVSFLCGLWAGPPANAPQREDKQQHNPSTTHHLFSFTFH